MSDGEIEVTLLQAGSDEEIIAKVKNCNDEYFVYKLEATAACPEAYCFGENVCLNLFVRIFSDIQ